MKYISTPEAHQRQVAAIGDQESMTLFNQSENRKPFALRGPRKMRGASAAKNAASQ